MTVKKPAGCQAAFATPQMGQRNTIFNTSYTLTLTLVRFPNPLAPDTFLM